ncbi:MAG: peptidylprolyl isomerase [bacterium]|nr:peptidylprolyl isomerase [bacterium]
MARKYSLAPERGQGGSLGKMQRGQYMRTGLPQIIEETAFSLKTGAYSGAVKSIYGWHVVHSIAKEDGKTLAFDEARSKITEELGEKKRNNALRAALERMKKKHPVKTYPERIR